MNPQISLPSYDIDHVFGYDSLVHSVHMLSTQPNATEVAGGRLQAAKDLPPATCHLQTATCHLQFLPRITLTRTAYVEDTSL